MPRYSDTVTSQGSNGAKAANSEIASICWLGCSQCHASFSDQPAFIYQVAPTIHLLRGEYILKLFRCIKKNSPHTNCMGGNLVKKCRLLLKLTEAHWSYAILLVVFLRTTSRRGATELIIETAPLASQMYTSAQKCFVYILIIVQYLLPFKNVVLLLVSYAVYIQLRPFISMPCYVSRPFKSCSFGL